MDGTKSTYYFIGTSCDIGAPVQRGKLYSPGMHFEKFGAKAMFTEAEALNVLAGGGAFVPEKDFDFTDEEIKKYPYPKFREKAPDEFKAKHATALAAISAHLEELQKRAALVAGDPVSTGEPNV